METSTKAMTGQEKTKAIIEKLGYIVTEDKYNLDVYVDQDRHEHVMVYRNENVKEKDIEQLDRLYCEVYGTGTMCWNRSQATNERLKDYPVGTTVMTIASVFQTICFGMNDMKLMSMVTAWVDGMLE